MAFLKALLLLSITPEMSEYFYLLTTSQRKMTKDKPCTPLGVYCAVCMSV